MTDEQQIFTPKEAAEYLTKRAGREITVARLAQLRRDGRVKAITKGKTTTVYLKDDLDRADISLRTGTTSSDGMRPAA